MTRVELTVQERKVVIITLLSLLVAIVTYGILWSSGVVQNKTWSLGGAIVGFLFSVFALNKVYGKEFLSHRRTSPSVNHSGERAIELIQGADQISIGMIAAVQSAKTYIFATGGQSRNEVYLDALTQRVKRHDVRYIRVITGNHIRHALCKHIQELGELAELGYVQAEKFGGVLVTDDTTILALPSANVSILDRVLKVTDEFVAADYRAYIAEVFGMSQKIDMTFVKGLCTTCRKDIAQP
jgi:hypothetical protein